MAKLKSKNVIFPLAGQHRAMGYQRQPPFTSVDCGNVLPRDATEQLARGGSRPGLARVFRTELGDGEPIRSLTTIRQLSQTSAHFGDNFSGAVPYTLGGPWLPLADFSELPRVLPLLPSCVLWYVFGGNPLSCGAMAPKQDDIDEGAGYVIEILVPPRLYSSNYYRWVGPYGEMAIVARMDGVNSYLTDGVLAHVNCVTNRLHLWVGESGVGTDSDSATLDRSAIRNGFVLRLLITEDKGTPSNGTIELQFLPLDGSASTSLEAAPTARPAGAYAGFWIKCEDGNENMSLIANFQWNYTIDASERAGTRVVAISGTDIYHEDSKGNMWPITTDATVTDGDVQLPAAELFGKLYIANGDEKVLMVEPCADTEAEQVAGSPESNAIATYESRLATAGSGESGGIPSGNDPYSWYMSAQNDATDWNTAGGLVTSAVSGNTGGIDTGKFPSPVTAFAAPSDDYLFIASVDAVAVFRGSPRRGASMDLLSSKVGFLGPMAYCITPGGRTFFLSRLGLYVLEGPVPPVPVSERMLPLALKNIDSVSNAVCLGYDPDRNAILISVSPWRGGTGVNYFYTLDPTGFWPVSFHADHQPFSMATVSADHLTAAGLILGCRDGYIRRFSRNAATDDGEAITSYVFIGPLKLGVNEGDSGLLAHLDAIMGGISGDVTWSLHVGDSAEEALVADAQESGTWSAGVADRESPFARGATCFLELSGTDRWTMESVRLAFEPYAVSTRS